MAKRKNTDRNLLEKATLIESLFESGLNDTQIAVALELSEADWAKDKVLHPELAAAEQNDRTKYLGGSTKKDQRWVTDLDKIEELAYQGLIEKQVAAMCGISQRVFVERKEEFPEIEIRTTRGAHED